MTDIALKTASLLECLPQEEQKLAYELVRRIVLAWDPDFTKLTPNEAAQLREAEAEIDRGDVVSDSEIDWDAD